MPLPNFCYILVDNKICEINRGTSKVIETGYTGTRATIDGLNLRLAVTRQQAAAMAAGIRLGWDHPAAIPEYYDVHGFE